MTSSKTTQKKHKQYVNDNPIEAITSIAQGVGGSFGSDLLSGATTDAWRQFLGRTEKDSEKKSGNLAQGEEIDFSHKKKKEEYLHVEEGFDYRAEILHGSHRIENKELQTVNMQVQEILAELQRLIKASKQMESQFKEVVVEQRVTRIGKYHTTFFSFVLSLVRKARIAAEDSDAWLAMFKSKKAQKGYWQMFKKHGTTFGLSNERVVATQTG